MLKFVKSGLYNRKNVFIFSKPEPDKRMVDQIEEKMSMERPYVILRSGEWG